MLHTWEHRYLLFYLFLILFGGCLCVSSNAQPIGESAPPAFTSPLQVTSDSGHTRLVWKHPDHSIEDAITFELQQSQSQDFSDSFVRYKGPDAASFISGLKNGTYYFRVRSIEPENAINQWSEPAIIIVQHHSMQLAAFLFIIGFIVFAATVFVVVNGTRKVDTIE